jgi:hypothetical protein
VPSTPLVPELPSIPLVPEVPPKAKASATCFMVALYDEPAGFWEVSPVITMWITSFSETPVASTLSVSL